MSRVAFPATFAYQPIVDIANREVFAFEALVRGKAQESAGDVFGRLSAGELHAFDRDARAAAVDLAARLGSAHRLSLNLLPQSLDTLDDAITSTLDAAARNHLSPDQLILEVTEGEVIRDASGFANKMNQWRGTGLKFAIDDFGAGYSGLNLLAEFQPDIVKLDMNLVRGIDSKGARQAIVRGVLRTCTDLGLEVIAEGVESEAEFHWFRRQGVVLYQGYLIARPAFESLDIPEGYARGRQDEGVAEPGRSSSQP